MQCKDQCINSLSDIKFTALHCTLYIIPHCTLHTHYTVQLFKQHPIQWVKLLPACSRCYQDRSPSPWLKAMLTLLYNSGEKPFTSTVCYFIQCRTLTPENSAHKTQHGHRMIIKFLVHSLNSRIFWAKIKRIDPREFNHLKVCTFCRS